MSSHGTVSNDKEQDHHSPSGSSQTSLNHSLPHLVKTTPKTRIQQTCGPPGTDSSWSTDTDALISSSKRKYTNYRQTHRRKQTGTLDEDAYHRQYWPENF